ncbi:hypothetical protein AU509_12150 [Lonsdalea britannica]|nr:hypothetical protein [Lonsdalea britannica]OSM95950.1 hypothetical protein AU509_12150 [Lonsdalea britannica]
MKKILLVTAIFLSLNAAASTSYTKEQLNSMDASGQYPEQESPVTKSVENVDFKSCRNSTYGVYSQILGNYPAKEIVDTGILYVVKLWTNDGVITVSCSEPDGKKIVTQSSYK